MISGLRRSLNGRDIEGSADPVAAACRRSRAKRALDAVGSFVLLVLFAPVMAAIALLMKVLDPGPLFFQWELVGADGRPVRSYKFRTMVAGAESLERSLRSRGVNEMESVYFKMRDDPRVTTLGRLLRKYSLDELPSLWSVLKGELSLVGPRPVRVAELQYLQDWHRQRFAAKPGLTSTWVLKGKNEIRDFDSIVEADLEYIRTWSLSQDLVILMKTVLYFFSGKNY